MGHVGGLYTIIIIATIGGLGYWTDIVLEFHLIGCLDPVDWSGGMDWTGMEWNGTVE